MDGSTHVEELDPSTRRCATDALAILARALAERSVPARPLRAEGPEAAPGEGLALVQDFIAIGDPELRQALLDTAAALSNRAA